MRTGCVVVIIFVGVMILVVTYAPHNRYVNARLSMLLNGKAFGRIVNKSDLERNQIMQLDARVLGFHSVALVYNEAECIGYIDYWGYYVPILVTSDGHNAKNSRNMSDEEWAQFKMRNMMKELEMRVNMRIILALAMAVMVVFCLKGYLIRIIRKILSKELWGQRNYGVRGEGSKPGSDPHIQQLNDRKPKE